MDHFDTSTMTYMATSMGLPNATPSDTFAKLSMPMDLMDHYSNYDANTFAGSEDLTFQGFQHQASPSLKRFSSTFEDPFSDVVSAFEHPTNQDPNETENPSIDRDNKLLSFSTPIFDYALLDYTYRRTTISLTAQLHGMFFLAESPWASAGDAGPPPSELTCYRRNLFQITGNITLPRALRCIVTEQGKQIPILSQELVISAVESTEANSVKIISVPWKTPVNPSAPAADEKIEREPPAIPLDLINVQEMDSDFANFPFQWKRLQFRIATANNGRRKELQQHFIVRLKVMATLATGGKVSICEVQSGAVIVRGRSPRNFQARKDMPLNGATGHGRKSSHLPGTLTRQSTGESSRKAQNNEPTSAPIKTEPAPPMSVQSFYDPADVQVPPDFFDDFLAGQAQQGAMTAVPPPDPVTLDARRDYAGYAATSPDFSRLVRPLPPTSVPINLSLVEDETPPKLIETPSSLEAPAKRVHVPPRPPSFSLNVISSPDESADLLYEYFPLSLDDWMPPVDAVYRPHVVHHIQVPSDPRDPKGAPRGGRSKRYFSEDVG